MNLLSEDGTNAILHVEKGGLPRHSVALLDQVRAADVRRVEGYLGTLSAEDYERIRAGLRQMLWL
ncbi:MAG: type II toxin-antitoxin system PemK/MazF family toxin [Anaerolineae bacterium]